MNFEWEMINKQLFSVFIRDLSKDNIINLKHMIEDIFLSPNKKKVTSQKKKDIIIQQNKLRLEKKEI